MEGEEEEVIEFENERMLTGLLWQFSFLQCKSKEKSYCIPVVDYQEEFVKCFHGGSTVEWSTTAVKNATSFVDIN